MECVFDFLLTEPSAPAADSVATAWERHRAVAARFATPLDAAVAGGYAADRVGYAFLSGYQEALRALLPALPEGPGALAATEEGGGHPAAIRTALAGADGAWTVSGTKTFATLGSSARWLVVIASAGATPEGRNRLRAVLVDAAGPGVTVTDRPPLPFAPEIPHATVVFDGAPATVLPGDGYADVLKPFRTVEDVHVLGAALGWLVRVGRGAGWPAAMIERLLAAVASVRGIDLTHASAPGTHIALGGVYAEFGRIVADSEPLWELADTEITARWARDRPLFEVAGRVRAQRLATAWRAVDSAVGN